jgi:hypothetical protein
MVELAITNGCKSDQENAGKTRLYTPIVETEYTMDGYATPYGTPVARCDAPLASID